MAKSTLTVVEISTVDGSVYRFPDIQADVLATLDKPSKDMTSLTLVNASGAVLTLPWRIVEKLWTPSKILWKRTYPV